MKIDQIFSLILIFYFFILIFPSFFYAYFTIKKYEEKKIKSACNKIMHKFQNDQKMIFIQDFFVTKLGNKKHVIKNILLDKRGLFLVYFVDEKNLLMASHLLKKNLQKAKIDSHTLSKITNQKIKIFSVFVFNQKPLKKFSKNFNIDFFAVPYKNFSNFFEINLNTIFEKYENFFVYKIASFLTNFSNASHEFFNQKNR